MITIKRGDVRVELSVEEALALIQSLSAGVAHAVKYKTSTGGVLPMPVEVNGEKKAAPGILSFQVNQ